ncbi:hypothetical protein DIPPA_06930 [Diplonema papillatum]|nr:hypothetical protein DIPPA_06930 [Diplonema papillatum]
MEIVATLEYFQWRLTRRVLNIATEGVMRPKKQAGVRKALEVFCINNWNKRAVWPSLYSQCLTDGKFLNKLTGDLARYEENEDEKTDRSKRKTVAIREAVSEAVERHAIEPVSAIPIVTAGSTMSMGKFRVDFDDRARALSTICGLEATAAVLLRYHSALAESTQWSIPPAVYEILVKELFCYGEGFASPLNSFMLANGGEYCSLFEDLDKNFKSHGSVFDLENPQELCLGWVFNPPFTLYHLNKAASLAAKWLRNNENMRIVVVGRSPANPNSVSSDHRGKKMQHTSPYAPLRPFVRAEIHLDPLAHYYLSSRRRPVHAAFPTSIYICGLPLEDESVVDRIRTAFCTRPGGDLPEP